MNDLINFGGAYPTDSILGDVSAYLTPEQLNQPLAPQTLVAPQKDEGMLPKPVISQAMLKTGLALMVADQQGIGAAAQFMAQQNAHEDAVKRAERRAARRDQLDEFELLGRIRERQIAEMQAKKKLQLSDRLKRENPDLANLIDLDPSKAAEVLAKRQTAGVGGPFEGTSIEAQDTNILLQGDPASDVYRAAYNRQAQAKIIRGEDGQVYSIQPDMSAYAVPGQPRAQAALTPPQQITDDQTLSQPSSLPASPVASTGGVPDTVTPSAKQTRIGGMTITQANLEGNTDSKSRFEAGLGRIMEKAEALEERGGLPQDIESTDDFILNPLRYAANTGFGQEVGRIFGAKDQDLRDQIQQEVPKLFLELRKGGGLTGKELDTVAEREFYLQSLFKRGAKIETILEAIKNNSLDFGTGDLNAQLQQGSEFSGLSDEEIQALAEQTGRSVEEIKVELGI